MTMSKKQSLDSQKCLFEEAIFTENNELKQNLEKLHTLV